MLPLDRYVRKRAGNRQHQSEADRQLYWSTFQKMAEQAPAPRMKSPVWLRVCRLFGAMRKVWIGRSQSQIQDVEQGARTSPLVSEERQV